MTDTTHPSPAEPRSDDGDRVLAIVNYVLFLIGPANGLTMLVAVILAYVRKDAASDWLKSHFIFQIRTFWWGLAFFLIGFATVWLFGLGFLVWLLGTVLVIIRAIVGLVRVADSRSHPDPRAFLY
jgi:uncharacterized membrane protein